MSEGWSLAVREPLQRFCDRYHLTTLPFHADQIIAAFLAYEAIFLFVSPILSGVLVKSIFTRLPRRTKINWHVHVVSFIQAVFISAFAIRIILSDPSRRNTTRDERLWGYSPPSGNVQAFAAGYFLWDLLVSIQHLSVLGPGSLVHAFCALLVTMTGFVSPLASRLA